MVSTNNCKELNVYLDQTCLEKVKFTKFLGVIIDECLTWKTHIDCVSKTVSRSIGVMNKLKYLVPKRNYIARLYCLIWIMGYLSGVVRVNHILINL